MTKIIKNNLENSFIILLIFLIVAVWVFSGWPQIWQKPEIPPKIQEAQAAITLVQTETGVVQPGTSVSATFGAAATANNLIIAICGARASSTLSITDFTPAINQTGIPSQGIFYKIASGGETTITCSSSANTRLGLHIYEYSGIDTTLPLDATASNTGNSALPNSGTVTTTNANDLLIAGIVINANTSFSAWSNFFIERNDFVNGGVAFLRSTYGGAERIVSATGSYTTTATAGASGAWRGQIAAFKEAVVITPASWKADEDTTSTAVVGEIFRLRIGVGNSGADALNYDYLLQYATKIEPACGDDETFYAVPITAVTEPLEMATSTYVANGDPTTDATKLSTPAGYTFVSGKIVADPYNSSGSFNLGTNQYTHFEFVLTANTTGTYCFRLTNAGIPLDEYPVYPELQITP